MTRTMNIPNLSFTIDANLNPGAAHQVALYADDYDPWGQTERVDVIDPSSSTVLDTRIISGFTGGEYLVWNVSGHVRIKVTNVGYPNAVASGLFFGGPRSS
jgi:hypothetical protein